MRLLLHTCCAPCIVAPLPELRGEGCEVTAFFFNPNIHPLLEFRRRMKAVRVLADQVDLPLLVDETYGLDEFLGAVWPDTAGRCQACYRMRIERTARTAAAGGFDAFTTSLLFSPQQQHERIVEFGRAAAAESGVEFLDRDSLLLGE